jgi:hypothetical protein
VEGYAVAHLIEALRNNPQGRGIDSPQGFGDFSMTESFRLYCVSGVH